MSLIPHICPNTPYMLTVTCVPQIIKCPIEYQGADFWDSARLAGHVCEVMYIGLFCHMNRALLPYEQGSFAVWIASLAMWIGSFAILYVKEYILYERTHSIWENTFYMRTHFFFLLIARSLCKRKHSVRENTFYVREHLFSGQVILIPQDLFETKSEMGHQRYIRYRNLKSQWRHHKVSIYENTFDSREHIL
jgi:hypothetical protein